MAILVTDNTFLRQFEVEINGVLAKIEYSEQERKIFLTKLIIPESVTNKNFQENFIKEVLSIIEDRNIYVMPTSPQIVSFIRKNKQYKHLLPIGVRI
jgi:tRNA U54 and U55 pseudouridine synthase Pus10